MSTSCYEEFGLSLGQDECHEEQDQRPRATVPLALGAWPEEDEKSTLRSVMRRTTDLPLGGTGVGSYFSLVALFAWSNSDSTIREHGRGQRQSS